MGAGPWWVLSFDFLGLDVGYWYLKFYTINTRDGSTPSETITHNFRKKDTNTHTAKLQNVCSIKISWIDCVEFKKSITRGRWRQGGSQWFRQILGKHLQWSKTVYCIDENRTEDGETKEYELTRRVINGVIRGVCYLVMV